MLLLGIFCTLLMIVLAVSIVEYFKIKAIYDEIRDFRKFMAQESLIHEHSLSDIKHEVKGFKIADAIYKRAHEEPQEVKVCHREDLNEFSSPQETSETNH